MTGSLRSSTAPLTVRRFRRSDWGWVQRWFEDETLDRELGPLDEEWRDHVLTETDGVELVVEEPGADSGTGAPVALIGIVWGGADHGAAGLPHAITDLAVDPARRRSSLGRRALDSALAWPGHPANDAWVAYVDQENPGASRSSPPSGGPIRASIRIRPTRTRCTGSPGPDDASLAEKRAPVADAPRPGGGAERHRGHRDAGMIGAVEMIEVDRA